MTVRRFTLSGMATRLRFTTTETALGPAGTVAWEVGVAGDVVVIASPLRWRVALDVLPLDAVRLPEPSELTAPF